MSLPRNSNSAKRPMPTAMPDCLVGDESESLVNRKHKVQAKPPNFDSSNKLVSPERRPAEPNKNPRPFMGTNFCQELEREVKLLRKVSSPALVTMA